jgi:peptidoglycan hydrolase-like protein with peptidoglycan-binding domain
MKASNKVSIFSYIRSFILFRLFNIKSKFYYLLLCSSAPLLLGFPNVASATEQQIAQAIPTVGINRPSLKAGSQGEVVSELQAALKLLGFYNGAVDGKFNDATAAAVTQFKEAAGLSANSIVDAATWQRLFPGESVVSSNTPLPSPTSSGFPVPTQTVSDLPRPVVISNPASIQTAPATRNSGSVQNVETVRTPTTPRTNTINRVSSTRPVQNRTSTTATTRTNTTNRSGRTNNSSASTTTTNTTNRPRRTNNSSASATRNNNSSTNSSKTTTQRAGIQYTAAGLPILRLGMRGEEVLELQEKLQRLGYLKSNPDGDFGSETEAAVKALQERYGMEPDGVAGGATWDILNRRRNRSRS